MGTPVDAEGFYRMTGESPSLDDLDRCNCSKAGTPGHRGCGVCKHNQPVFRCQECFSKGGEPRQIKPSGERIEPCCENEDRTLDGGCRNCGDPCL